MLHLKAPKELTGRPQLFRKCFLQIFLRAAHTKAGYMGSADSGCEGHRQKLVFFALWCQSRDGRMTRLHPQDKDG